jgi:hypothetical protein
MDAEKRDWGTGIGDWMNWKFSIFPPLHFPSNPLPPGTFRFPNYQPPIPNF